MRKTARQKIAEGLEQRGYTLLTPVRQWHYGWRQRSAGACSWSVRVRQGTGPAFDVMSQEPMTAVAATPVDRWIIGPSRITERAGQCDCWLDLPWRPKACRRGEMARQESSFKFQVTVGDGAGGFQQVSGLSVTPEEVELPVFRHPADAFKDWVASVARPLPEMDDRPSGVWNPLPMLVGATVVEKSGERRVITAARGRVCRNGKFDLEITTDDGRTNQFLGLYPTGVHYDDAYERSGEEDGAGGVAAEVALSVLHASLPPAGETSGGQSEKG